MSRDVLCHDEPEKSSSTDLQASQSGAGDDTFSAVLNNAVLLYVIVCSCAGISKLGFVQLCVRAPPVCFTGTKDTLFVCVHASFGLRG